MRRRKLSGEGKEIHIRAGRKVGMDNIKIMLFDVFYRLREMVIRLEMSLPGDTSSNEGAREKRKEPCPMPWIHRAQQMTPLPLGLLVLHQNGRANSPSNISSW